MAPLPYFDSHAHLDAAAFSGDLETVLGRAVEAGLDRIITVGTGLVSCEAAVGLCERFPLLRAAIGIDPHGASQFSEVAERRLRALAKDPRVVAIGETGLDYHYYYSPESAQQLSFRKHVRLARDLGLPLIIHNRKANADVLRILHDESSPGDPALVLHCFDASMDFAQACLDLGAWISFSGMITFPKREDLHQAAALVPADRLLVETDCPYLAPTPRRGQRNEPAFVVHTVEQLAALRGVSLVVLLSQLRANLRSVFGP
jgi:TatD DNase family protein